MKLLKYQKQPKDVEVYIYGIVRIFIIISFIYF